MMKSVHYAVPPQSNDGSASSTADKAKSENIGFLSKLAKNIGIFKLFTSNVSNGSKLPERKTTGEYKSCVGNSAEVKENIKEKNAQVQMVSKVKSNCDETYSKEIVKSTGLFTSSISSQKVMPIINSNNVHQLPSKHTVSNIKSSTSSNHGNYTLPIATQPSVVNNTAVKQPSPVKNIVSKKSSTLVQTSLNTGRNIQLQTVPVNFFTPMKRTSTKESTPQRDITCSALQDSNVDQLASQFNGLGISSIASPSKVRSTSGVLPQVRSGHTKSTVQYYKNVPLEPQVHEVLSRAPADLQPNIVKEPYQSPVHYLNVHFKLLREDFIRPLRDGIQQLRKDFSDYGELCKNQNGTLYSNCRFICLSARKKVVGYEFCFDVSDQILSDRRKIIRSLIGGTLLAFSCNNFKTFFFGVVAQTDEHDMIYRKVITVELCNGKRLAFTEFNRSYAMMEPSSFFAPYYFVMKTLQTFSNENFPFEQYIINVKKHIDAPVYFTKDRSILTACDLSTNVGEELGFNSVQFEAYKTALTKELAIIQGPPGTGKTFVGLKIVEGFLKNKPLKQYMDGPILIVCFTNHALDQFIEGVLRYTQNVCRLGFSKSNEKVKPYNHLQIIETFYGIKDVIKGLKSVRKNKDVFITMEDFDQMFTPNQHDGLFTMRVRSFKTDCYEKRKYSAQLMKAYFFMFVNSSFNRPDVFKRGAIRSKCRGFEKQLERISMMISLINSFSGIVHVKHLECFMDNISLFVLKVPGKLESWLTKENSLQDLVQLEKNQMCSESDDDSDMLSSSNESTDVKKNTFFTLDLTDIRAEIESTEALLLDYEKKISCIELEADYKFVMEKLVECKLKLVKLRKLNDLMTGMLNNLKEGNVNMKEIEKDIVKNILSTKDLHTMCIENRWKLYCYWVENYRQTLYIKMETLGLKYKAAICKFENNVRHPELLDMLQTKDVIAMTTTKAAKIQSVLSELKPKIVVIEEAAEVLETHIIASLSKHCEHMVLIGDHKQLRPGTSVHELAARYYLDVSLFERLSLNGLHHVTLKVQHRMRPEICELLTPTIYSNLMNHESVYKFPNVRGMSSNVQFFDHKYLEGKNIAEHSTWNVFEVNILLNLSAFLLKQGYHPRDITIIAAYKGQVELFESAIDKRYKFLSKILVTSIDGYQGEENRIILLSLVRSNTNNNIGFLRTPNRVCVALSRAKQGLFIMGNMDNLSYDSELWRDIKNKLVARRAIGPSFRLKCEKHRTTPVIRALEDFDGCCCLRR